MRYISLLICGLAAILLCSSPIVHGDEKPAAGESGVTIGEMRIQTVPAMTYLYTSAETSFAKMGEPVKAAFDKVIAAASEAKLPIARSMMVYQDNPHFKPDKVFKVEIGLIISGDAKLPDGAAADLKMRKTEAFRCATILYTGTVEQQGQAYQKLIPALRAAGHTPTGEEREMCLYWEGRESSNNVYIMQIGIK